MSTIVTRAGKGTPLTNAEVDANFTNLNADKVETITSADGSVILSRVGTTIDFSVGVSNETSNLIAPVRNETGATLTKGTVVYPSGASGNKMLVQKALATSDSTSAQTYGMVQADIPNNQNGFVVISGVVSGLDTSGLTEGGILYLSPTTAGTYTQTKPYAPDHLVYVGVVTRVHATQGEIQTRIQNGYELDEIHNVSAQTPANGQTIVYNSSTQLWEQSNAPVISGTTIDNTVIGGTTPAAGTFTTLKVNGTGGATGLAIGQDSGATFNSERLFFEGTSGTVAIYNAANTINFTTSATTGSSTGTQQFRVSHTGSAVNYVQVTGAATGSAPVISAQGSDTNVALNFTSKSGGHLNFFSNSSASRQFQVSHTAGTIVNYLSATGAATTAAPVLSAQGSDTNIDLNLTTKGTGAVNLNTANGLALKVTDAGVGAIENYWRVEGRNISGSPTMYVEGAGTNVNSIFATKGAGSHNFTTSGSRTNTQFTVAHTASAVNYVQVTGAATNTSPYVSAQGSDSAVSVNLASKGAGSVFLRTNGTTIQFQVADVNSAVNYFRTQGAAAGASPVLSAQGSDTNIDINLTTKGTGSVVANTGNGAALRVSDLGGTVVAGLGVFAGSSSQNSVYLTPFGSVTNGNIIIAAKGSQFVGLGTNTSNNSNATEQMRVTHTASAVNYVQVTGSATGGNPTISAQGSDTNVPLQIQAKGTSGILFNVNGGSGFRVRDGGASPVNYAYATGATTGAAPKIAVDGSDTNIPLVLQPKGTGALQAQQTDSTATGGNARGANAVDWSTTRSTAAQVASGGSSVVAGGAGNTASATYAIVSGGVGNTTSGFASAVIGGNSNSTTSAYSFTGSGRYNVSSGAYSAIAGGENNLATGYHNFIGGGFKNSGTANAAVTTQSGTMNGTTAVTLSGSNASIKVGQFVTGTSIQTDPPTYVAAISGTSLTLSQAASGSSTSTLSFYTPHGIVVGGGNNQATGSYSFIGGGGDAGTATNRNIASGDWSAVAGGAKNVASGKGAFIGGGGGDGAAFYQNTASGTSATIVCGTNNTVTSVAGFIGAGVSNGNTGGYGFVGGGVQNTVNSTAGGILAGFNGTTRSLQGNHVFPACASPIANTSGVSQSSLLVLGRQTTDATPTLLASDSTTPSTINQIILPNNAAYHFKGSVIANVTGAANGAAWRIEGAIMRGANAASTVLIGTPTVDRIGTTAGASLWTVTATADTTNGGLAITVTGAASTTIRWVAKLETTEVTF